MEGATKALAQLLTNSSYCDLPVQVRHEGRRAFLNWLGCTLGGCQHEVVETAMAAISEFAGPPQATVIGRNMRLDTVNAAFVNCMSSSAYAFDDTHLVSITHPTGPVAATLMAMCEDRAVNGRDFLNALILGIETECRVSNALVAPPAKCHLGFYMTGLTGGIGAAAALGKILEFDLQHMMWAIGIAAVQGAGFRATHATMCSSFVPAHAARNGLFAALLARKGFTSSERILEATNGFADVYADPPNLDAITDGWGIRYETSSTAYKPYPAGIFTHPAIEASLVLVQQHDVDASAIDRIVLEVHPFVDKLTARPEPKTALDAQVSVQHWIAAALLSGRAGLDETGVECVNDPAVVALRRRVEVKVNKDFADDEAKVRLYVKGGEELEAHIEHCIGSVDRPLSDDQLEQKFLMQCDGLMSPDHARELADRCWQLDELKNISELVTLLCQCRK